MEYLLKLYCKRKLCFTGIVPGGMSTTSPYMSNLLNKLLYTVEGGIDSVKSNLCKKAGIQIRGQMSLSIVISGRGLQMTLTKLHQYDLSDLLCTCHMTFDPTEITLGLQAPNKFWL